MRESNKITGVNPEVAMKIVNMDIHPLFQIPCALSLPEMGGSEQYI